MNNSIMAQTNKGQKLSPLQSIKSYCKHHCCCDDRQSWVDCSLTNCFLWRYRLGLGNRGSKSKQPSGTHNFNKNGATGGDQ